MRLSEKVVLVTGSSRGIGREIAVAMAREGADIIVNYSQNKGAALDTAEKIKALGRRAVVVQASVSERSQVERLFEEAMRRIRSTGCAGQQCGRFSHQTLCWCDR